MGNESKDHVCSVARKSFWGVSNQVRYKPDCATIIKGGEKLENVRFRKNRDCTIYVAKTKTVISYAVTAQLICVFVFAYAKSRLSHDAVHMFKGMHTWTDFSGACIT